MRYLLSLVVVALCNLCVQSHPLPAGQIIQYSVSSKYFNRENSNSLYNVLSKIHYGENAVLSTSSSPLQPSVDHGAETITFSNENEKVDVKNDETTMTSMEMQVTTSNESPEAPVATDDVTDEHHKNHQELVIDATMKDNLTDIDKSITALIEKVVIEQIEKLVKTDTDTEIKKKLLNEQKDVIEKNDLVHESIAISDTTDKAAQSDDKSEDDDDDDDNDRVSETTMAISSEKSAVEMDEDVVHDEEKKEATTMNTDTMPEMSIIESDDLDSENESTNVPTNQPEKTENIETISADNVEETQGHHDEEEKEQQQEEDSKTDNSEIPALHSNSLINAIGDLLSSVLGIPVNIYEDNVHIYGVTNASDSVDDENIHTTAVAPVEDEIVTVTTEIDILEHSAEQELSSSTSALEFNENNVNTEESDVQDNKSDDEIAPNDAIMPQQPGPNVIANEIDLKIENLANNLHDTNFMTENTPEIYTETVREPSYEDDIKDIDDELEALPALMAEEEATKPVSFQESVNHIMNLVRGTEDRMALENAHNIVDSALIDHKAVNDNVNHLLNVALKEIETNFGMNQNNKEIEIPTEELDVLDHEREEIIKSFETDINESLINSSIEDQDNFVPNVAKAALYHRFQYGDDF